MNRRIVIIDPSETLNSTKYWGLGLGTEIYSTDSLSKLSDQELKSGLNLGPTDAAMLVGGNGYSFFFEKTGLHAGIRSENWFDCAKLERLSVEGGSYVKVQADLPTPEEVRVFMSSDFTRDVDFSWFKSKVIHDFQGAMKFLDWLDSLPIDEDLGFDFETSGKALDKWFELSGLSLCNRNFGGFISLTDIRHTSTKEEYSLLMRRLGYFLNKRQSHLVTYNLQFEQAVSHRMFGVDLYNLLDASVYNVLDGLNLKKYSLKWTAQRVLGVKVWDTEFDWISDTIDSMLYVEEGKLKKEKHKVLKVNPGNFEQTEEWKALCERYPDYIDEFRALMLEYFGNCFMVVPSEILGKYCNLDAFYTLMIHLTKKQEYSEDAIRTFMDNARLGARLHNCGLYIDEPLRLKYSLFCKKMMAWGITYGATSRCFIKMDKHAKKMANIDKYSEVSKKLLYNNTFFNGDPIEITKYILTNNVDEMDAYELGLDEGKLLFEYGADFAVEFVDKLREAMEECEMIKLYKKTGQKVLKKKIDNTVGGKKKLIQVLSQKIIPLIGLDKITINDKHIELEKYLYYKKAFDELIKISKNQLNDINNIPEKIYGFGKQFDLVEYSDFIASNYFKVRSPQENDEICLEFTQLYKPETAYLAAILDSTQQLNNAEKFYSELGIKTIEEAYQHFANNMNSVCNGAPVDQTCYPEKVYTLAMQYYKNPSCDQMKDIWDNFNGYIAQEQFFGYITDQYAEYGKPFSESDFNNRFFFMRKLVLNYLLYKKNAKVLSTYIEGMMNTGLWVVEDKNHFPIREADPNEPGAVRKIFTRYEINTKSSKRWSSPMHTIISHADFKDILGTPYHIDDRGNIVYEDFIETYFDISSAEVKAAGFASGDPDLIDKFNKGEDIYVYSAKLYLGDRFDQLDKKQKKMWRKRYLKVPFQGVMSRIISGQKR